MQVRDALFHPELLFQQEKARNRNSIYTIFLTARNGNPEVRMYDMYIQTHGKKYMCVHMCTYIFIHICMYTHILCVYVPIHMYIHIFMTL